MMRAACAIGLSLLLLAGCAATTHAPPATAAAGPLHTDMIITRQTAKTPEQTVDAIKAYAESQKWVFFGVNRVKPPQGEIAIVKVCIPAVGAVMWPLGLQTSALLPCGNLGVYRKDGRTEVAMLDPKYMSVLVPHPEVSRASAMASPLLMGMLDNVTR